MLTDRYPPFTLEPGPYAVELDVPAAGRLNRAAVLFRLILLVPAGIVATLLNMGVLAAMVVIWLIVLVAGRMPRSIFEALSAVLRYQMRYYAFAAMLTSEYPKRLLGDAGLAPDAEPAPTPTDERDGAAVDPVPLAMPSPRITRLVLSKAGKRLVILFIVLGVLTYGGSTVIGSVTSAQTASARDDFIEYDRAAGVASALYQREAQRCALSGGLPCLQAANVRLADAIARFQRQLGSIKFPAIALEDADALDQSLAVMERRLRELAMSPDAPTYESRFAALQQAASKVTDDETNLAQALGATGQP